MINKELYHMYENGGMKDNRKKLDYTLLPWNVLEDVIRVMEYGAEKYNRDNWKKVPYEEYVKATLRHVIDFIQGEDYDQESGYHHLSHAICDLLYSFANYLSYRSENSKTKVEKEDEKKQYNLFDEIIENDRVMMEIDEVFDALNLDASGIPKDFYKRRR